MTARLEGQRDRKHYGLYTDYSTIYIPFLVSVISLHASADSSRLFFRFRWTQFVLVSSTILVGERVN